MDIQISDHFSSKRLIRFVLPSIIMMVFTSVYGVVDGFFVSNYAGKVAFAGVNLVMPFIMILGTFGFMIGTGGSALVGKTLGEGDRKKANEIFSFLVMSVIVLGVIVTIVAEIFLKRVVVSLGADSEMLPYCVAYARIGLCTVTFFMLQNIFQSFLITAGKPKIGLAVTVSAGVCNMVLDVFFVGLFKWGVAGASLATSFSELIGGGVPLAYFLLNRSSDLRIIKPTMELKALLKACTNGASELMTNVSMSLVNMLYNIQLMKYFGQNGVAAYGMIMYVNFAFIASFIGYSIGVAPIISFNFGAKNHKELQNIFKKSLVVLVSMSVIITALAMTLSHPLAHLFVGYDNELYSLAIRAFRLFSISFLLAGLNIFASDFFTALNNGVVSACISFSRVLLFQVIAIFVLPSMFGSSAIWLSMAMSEIASLVVVIIFVITNRRKYKYF